MGEHGRPRPLVQTPDMNSGDQVRQRPLEADLDIVPPSSALAGLERRYRQARRVLLASLTLLAIVTGWYLLEDGIGPADLVLAMALLALALTVYVADATSAAMTRERLVREASIRRIVSGLSRSLSAEAVVDTVIDHLRSATDADHVVVARVSGGGNVEVTLVAAQADAPRSRTVLGPEIGMPAEREDPEAGGATLDSPEASDVASAAAEEIARRVRSTYGLQQTLSTALVAERRFLGALILARRGRETWSDGDRRLLAWAADEVASAFQRTYALEAAERGAKIDKLTGLPNRRYFDEALDIEGPRRRANDTMGILMIDIDHFKLLNDRFGHATGDRVLQAVAVAIARAVREEDTPARYGGEEFAVLLRRTGSAEAVEVAERIRRAVVRLHPSSLGISEPVTVSVGVAVASPDGTPITKLVERADRALYRAKRQGRDRVISI
jgi:diguanylate cyclase (GGDEF)-like protein